MRCGDALPSRGAFSSGECVRCRRTSPAIDAGRAAGIYTGTLRTIIHAFKYRGRRSLAAPLARSMRHHAGDLLTDIDWIVPVPLHPRRVRQRGFNQADDLARALKLPMLRALRRIRPTRPQSELPAARRHRNVRGAFALARRCMPRGSPPRAVAIFHRARVWPQRPAALLDGRCVVLVDDVSTTGATLNACAQVLKAAGAREVRALTAARAVRTRSDESPPPPLPAPAPR
jgi:predicted amidophosphoribosyltransferase